MKSNDALGFFSLGIVMGFLPMMLPGFFPPNAGDGSSTSALWLQLMGFLNGSMGGIHLLRTQLLPWTARMFALKPAQLDPAISAVVLRPQVTKYVRPEHEASRQAAA